MQEQDGQEADLFALWTWTNGQTAWILFMIL